MSENKNKFSAFPATALSDWQIAAREELDGADATEKLAHRGEGWIIQPFYDQNQNQDREAAPLLSDSGDIYLGPRAWHSCPRIHEGKAEKMNEMALEHLKQGADGILFEVNEDINLNILLEGIEWPYCSLNFLAKKNPSAVMESLGHFIGDTRAELHGAFFGNALPPDSMAGNFHFAGFEMGMSPSPVEQIIQGFNRMSSTLKEKFPKKAGQVAFTVSIGPDFFMELAKLRAIRTVWKKFLKETQSNPETPLLIHTFSTSWANKNYEPQGNMLKSTTAAMSAILGGCDSLTLDPENPNQPMMARVARNVSHILREESYFSKVADATAGSYFIENLTAQLTASAWNSIRLAL